MRRSELVEAKGRAGLIDLKVNQVGNVGIVGEDAAPARFGKRAAEPKADRGQFIIRLAIV